MQPFDHKIIILRKPPSEAMLGAAAEAARGKAGGSRQQPQHWGSLVLGWGEGTWGSQPGGRGNGPHLEKDIL